MRCAPLLAVFLSGLAFLYAAWLVLCPQPRVIQRDVAPVQCDPWAEFNRSVRDAAWRNPMDGRNSDMPGGLR